MALSVVSFCAYLTDFDGLAGTKPSNDTFSAIKFVKAIKGESVNGYAHVPVPIGNPVSRRLDDTNRSDVYAWFGEMAANYVLNLPPPRPTSIGIVPVPGSKSTSISDVKASTVFRLAHEVATRLPDAHTLAMLWWDQPMESARKQGGTRDPVELYSHLVVARLKGTISHWILIDDAYASGGHLRAAEAKLRKAGFTAAFAMTAARTIHAEESAPFSISTTELGRLPP